MAKTKSPTSTRDIVPSEKKTKFSATSANPNPKKKYRGQGK